MTNDELLQKLQDGIYKKDVDFNAVFQAVYTTLGWTDEVAAKMMRTSRPVIRNWLRGPAAPAMHVRPTVYALLRRHLLAPDPQ